MKKVLFSFRRVASMSLAVVAIAGLLAACNKNDSVNTPIPAAGLMVFNLAPDREAVGFSLSGNVLSNAPLSYTNFNGYYQNIYTGNREVEAFGFRDSVYASSTFNFENNVQYSLFLTGNNGKYQNIIAKDEIDSNATADRAYVRYINAIPDSVNTPEVKITTGGNTISDLPASFNTVSDFTAVTGGDVTISVNNGTTISAERTLQLVNGKAYTALLIGVPGATNDLQKIQIRYIENGSIPAAVTDK